MLSPLKWAEVTDFSADKLDNIPTWHTNNKVR